MHINRCNTTETLSFFLNFFLSYVRIITTTFALFKYTNPLGLLLSYRSFVMLARFVVSCHLCQFRQFCLGSCALSLWPPSNKLKACLAVYLPLKLSLTRKILHEYSCFTSVGFTWILLVQNQTICIA